MAAPEKLIIDTPEQIALEFPLASAGSRFLALAIDTLIQIAGFVLLVGAALGFQWLGVRLGAGIGVWGAAIVIVLGFALYYGYFAAFEALWSGQTPGKRQVGLRVISVTGRPIGAFDSILRNLLRIVDQLPGIYAVGVLSVFLTERNQRLGDLAAGTVVVHDRAVERPAAAPARERPSTRYGAARLAAEEITVVETFLSRRTSLDDTFRLQAARQLAARVRERLGPPADTTEDDERLLEEVTAEYRAQPYR